ncbi:MAG: apolipoprotein A1/A4/E family protein [Actinomycetota bacterium]|nr:apolipoprotein A1/A4/E family protein [Actinomycetota bacterium]
MLYQVRRRVAEFLTGPPTVAAVDVAGRRRTAPACAVAGVEDVSVSYCDEFCARGVGAARESRADEWRRYAMEGEIGDEQTTQPPGGEEPKEQGRAGEVGGTIKDRLEEVKEKVGPKVEDVKEKLGPKIEETREKLGPKVEKARGKLGQAFSKLGAMLSRKK